jgi:micrococcal nuclease
MGAAMTGTADGFPLWHYRGSAVRIIDGDTFVLEVDLGFRVFHELSIRIAGIDAPEVTGATKEAGLAATDALHDLIGGLPLYVRTDRDRRSFARYVGWVYADAGGGELLDVAAAMVAGGFAQRVSP